MTSKSADYYKWPLESQNKQSKASVNKVTVGKNQVMPACKIIVDKMLGQDAVREIENVSLSNSTINVSMTCHMMLKRFCMINRKITVSLSRLISQQISPIKVML
jgi:hypothetical protein